MSDKKKRIEEKILEHELVPKHELLTREEALGVLRELGIRPEQLPWIRASDPIAKLLGAKPGDIIRIVRKSPTAGTSVAYRFVVVG
ncbi:MAG: DNA-directed RNA polymerase subunit H [Sulfolobales archaeon]|nr:DNA-directed RNA polymerase subunit H [Sulfolobales archaeon]MCX8208844.1 DNA-directed RNA polymerase subunit H [Sulfolobales archaeon]MDW8010201.1 DNA-directed RNA polymerase subunit H [Sulfolobales archaeon]